MTGTFGGSVLNNGMTRGFPFTYTISSANTWENKTVTVIGCPDGTWDPTNTTGIRVHWSMGAHANRSDTAGQWSSTTFSFHPTGATDVVATNGATLQVTGCQVEEGNTATLFEHRPFQQELALAQRYFTLINADGSIDNFAPVGIGRFYSSFQAQIFIPLPNSMRQPPTIEAGSTTAADTFAINQDGGFTAGVCNSLALNERSFTSITLSVTSSTISGQTTGTATTMYCDGSDNAKLGLTAEL